MKTKTLLISQLFTPRSPLMRFTALLLIFIFIGTVSLQAADQYFDGSGSNTLTASKWGTSNAGPFTSAFTTGNTAVFATINGTGSGAGGISVGGIRAEESFTLSSPSGTLTTGGTVATINVFTGKVLDFGSLSISTAAGTGFIKSGNGVYASAGAAFTGGFTMNAGTMIVRGVNAMGAGGALTLNGGTVASNATRDLTGKYAGGITIGGNVQFGEFAANVALANDTANLTFSNNMALGAATRTLTLGNKGNVTFGGVISGSVGSGITFNAASGADSTVASNGTFAITNTANLFTGAININGPEVTFAADGSLGNTANTLNIDGGRFTATGSFTLTAGRGIQLGSTAGTSISTKGGSTVLIYNGVIADKTSGGILTKQGGGTLQLGGQSTYTGATAINNGTLQITTGNDRLPTGTVVSIGQAASTNLGILDLNGRNQQIAGLQSTSGSNNTSNTNVVTSATAATLTINNSSDYVYSDGTQANSGIISGGISLVKQGNGKQTLGGVNTYTGSTTISGGTLALGSTGSINNSTSISVAGGATYDVSAVSSYALFSGQTIKGSGTVIGAMTVAASTTILPGSATTTGKLTTGELTFANSSAFNWNLLNGDTSGTTAGTDYSQINSGALNLSGVTTAGVTLNIAGLAGLTNWSAANNNSWSILTTTGITGWNNGDFAIGSVTGLTGATASNFSVQQSGNNLNLVYTAASTALYWTGSSNSWSSTSPGAGNNGTWTQANGWDSAQTANFAGTAGAVTVGTVTANKGITFSTTGYSLSGGTITLSSTGSNNVITTDANVTATIASALSTSAGIAKSGNGTLIFTSAQSYTGGTSVSAGTLQLGDGASNNGSVAGDISNNSAVAFANHNDQIYNGAITGAGSLSKSGAGKLTLNGTSNYGGGTTITGGTLALGTAGDTLADAGAVTINGGTLDIGTVGDAVGLVTLTSGNITGSGGTLVASSYIVNNASGTTTISGVTLDSTGGLTKSGAGGLTLSGTNAYQGGTQINGGSISVSSDANLGDSAGVLGINNGGTLSLTGNVTLARALTIGTGGGTIANGGYNFSTSQIPPATTATINGTLATTGSGDVALNGLTTFGAAGALNIGTGGSVTLGQSSGTINMGIGGTFDGNLIIGSTSRVNFNSGSFGGAGQIQVQTSLASITASGSSATGTIGNEIFLNSTNAGGSFTTNIGATSGNTLILNGAITGSSDVNFATGAGGFIQNGGAGLVLLNAASTYTGNTTFNNSSGGIIRLGITNALPTTTELSFGTVALSGSGPGTLDLNGFDQTVAALSFGGFGTAATAKITNSVTGNSVLTVSGSSTPANSFSGIIQDGGSGKTISLIKDGANTLTLAGTNTYTGGTTINGGVLKLGGSGNILADSGAVTLGGGTFDINAANESVGTVTLNSGSIINSGVDQTKALTGTSYNVKSGSVSAVLGGSGITLTKNSDGTGSGGSVTLSGVNTYSGDTTVNAGKLIVSGSISSNTTVNTGASLVVNGTLSGDLTTASGATLSGTGTIGSSGSLTTINGIHNPGNSPGIQSFLGNLSYNNATVNWELWDNTNVNQLNPNAVYDQINVTGNLNFTGINYLNLSFKDTVNGTGSLVSWTDTFWLHDRTWTLYNVSGTSSFDNLSLNVIDWQDSTGASLGTRGSFALGTNGVLNYTAFAAPEPSRAVLMLFGAVGLLMRRRRKA